MLFGIQEGNGSTYNTIQLQRSHEKALSFNFSISVRDKKPGDIEPDFAGPLVQGRKGERFIYIDIGTYAGDPSSEWARRLKIPLMGISWQTIEALQNKTSRLQLVILGTSKDGGPACGSVKPFTGWDLFP